MLFRETLPAQCRVRDETRDLHSEYDNVLPDIKGYYTSGER
jgi:hypothetical protein